MLEISGVGARKMEVYGELFLTEINAYLNQKTGSTSNTALKSYELFAQGISVEEIAEQRSLKPVTIISHLCKCYLEGKPVSLDQFISADELAQVKAQKTLLGDPQELKPYFEALKEQIPYERIRIAVTLLSRGS